MELALAPAAETLPPPLDFKDPTIAKPHRVIFGTFFIADDEFGIEMTELQEVAPPPRKLQPMPLAPDYLRGLFNLRGRIIPVVDLRLLLHLPVAVPGEEDIPCMVILTQGPACIGVLFDAIGEILRLKPADIFPFQTRNPAPGSKGSPIKSMFTLKEGERIIQILDFQSLLAIQNLPALERRTPARLADKNFVTERMRDLRREKLIGFTVGEFRLAFEMKRVLGVLDRKDVRPSPRKSALCDSVVRFGRRMVAVVPLERLLKIQAPEPPRRIMVCRVGEQDEVGFEIDDVIGIMPFFPEKVLPIPILNEHRQSIVRGCFTHSDGAEFLVLNEAGTLSSPEIVELSVGHRKIANQQAAEEAAANGPLISLLTFRMGKLYGIRLLDVVEVLPPPKDLIRTPSMPAAVLGVLSLRGEPISLVDPRHLLQLDPAPAGQPSNILVFRYQGKKVAMLIDAVDSIVDVPAGPALELPDIFFREEQHRLKSSFERGLHLETNGVKSVILVLGAEQIVRLLVAALNADQSPHPPLPPGAPPSQSQGEPLAKAEAPGAPRQAALA